MPYTKEELDNLEFYQKLARRDEQDYVVRINKATDEGDTTSGILRDKSGNIVLFEKIIPGSGTDGTSHPFNYLLSWVRGWFIYEENEELNNIIDREFTEF
tara:strand:+ start:2290 stop:2589 length:300 start_codon:yes stop_codon:yes gene_type:complete